MAKQEYSMGPISCVLRTPPFPGARSAGTAISVPAETPLDAILAACAAKTLERDDVERASVLGATMVAQRVGGSFWAPPVPRRATTLLRPASMAQAQALAHGIQRAPDEYLALLPAQGWARKAALLFKRRGIAVEIGDRDPWSLLREAERIEADGNDEWIFLALISGLSVRTLSAGHFSGWGLTEDPSDAPAKGTLDIARLIHAIILNGASYRDCFTGRSTGAEAAIDRLGFWRGIIDANRAVAAACGIARWKRREMRAFLWAGRERPLRFHRRAELALDAAKMAGGAVAVWPSRAPLGLDRHAGKARVPIRQVEDGFIRSVGLGSALHPPLSVVVDASGIYYDPHRPSDLETLLAETRFSDHLLERAERLIGEIVSAGISKYDRGRGRFTDLPSVGRRVLVTGQVEDDRSVQLGGGDVTGNLDLLRRARETEPDAFLLFKPHPDVEAGHRKGRVADGEALRFADRVVRDASMPALLDAVDAVHVWTSLAGFEALLRGRQVITHGCPFFAGWGLTTDLGPRLQRRGRRLTLPELVAATIILYPRYLDPETLLPCPPEVLIARMAQSGGAKPTLLTELRRIQGQLRVQLARWAA
jgi:capsular polysaccharide export protein